MKKLIICLLTALSTSAFAGNEYQCGKITYLEALPASTFIKIEAGEEINISASHHQTLIALAYINNVSVCASVRLKKINPTGYTNLNDRVDSMIGLTVVK